MFGFVPSAATQSSSQLKKHACPINMNYWSTCKNYNFSVWEFYHIREIRESEVNTFLWQETKWFWFLGSLQSTKYKSGTWLSTLLAEGHTGKDRAREPSQGSTGPSHSDWVLNMQISKDKKPLHLTGAIKWCYYLVMVLFWRLKIWYNDAILM